jgi:hypothetical protein
MTELTTADRLRVYAKAGTGHVDVSLTPEAAEGWADLMDMRERVEAALQSYEAATAALIVQRESLEATQRRNGWWLWTYVLILTAAGIGL